MHQRPFDFKHWIADTRRLTPLERGIYFDMLAEYYTSETALPDDLDRLCRLVGALEKKEREAVALVRDRYWTTVEDGIIQLRTAAEILMGKTIINNKKNGASKVPSISGPAEAKDLIRSRLAHAQTIEGANGRPVHGISSASLVSLVRANGGANGRANGGANGAASLVSIIQDPVIQHPTPNKPAPKGGAAAVSVDEAWAWAQGFNRGNAYGIEIDHAMVLDWHDDRTNLGWVTIRSGSEIPIRDWQADLRSFARMVLRNSGAPRAGFAQKNKGGGGPIQRPTVAIRQPKTHKGFEAPPCDWRAELVALYPVEECPNADYTLAWGEYEPETREAIRKECVRAGILPAEWVQPPLKTEN